METELNQIISDFRDVAERLSLPGWPATLDLELLPAPHTPGPLPKGCSAVYVFALADPAQSRGNVSRILKVGRVGPRSNARFQFQHYQPNAARSSLAKSLLAYRSLWPWLGIIDLDESTVHAWMLEHLDRANIYVPGESRALLPDLEVYVRGRLGGSVYEGAA